MERGLSGVKSSWGFELDWKRNKGGRMDFCMRGKERWGAGLRSTERMVSESPRGRRLRALKNVCFSGSCGNREYGVVRETQAVSLQLSIEPARGRGRGLLRWRMRLGRQVTSSGDVATS